MDVIVNAAWVIFAVAVLAAAIVDSIKVKR